MAVMAVEAGRERRWWEFWRSPTGQPGWARPALLGIAAVAALLYARNIASAGFEGFYSVAVKSMSVSWKAFVFGAFDPNATITLDKLAGSFVPQAISARIFGFHAWSLALPQVIEGIISVLVMYRVVRRWAGPAAGLLGAAIFAVTPVAVSMFGHSMEDGALTLCLVLAADSCQRAMMEGRLRSLIWAGVWVGLGFQAKMLQAWIVLPALAAGYLVTAPLPVRRRVRDLAIGGAVMLAVSLSWIAVYTFMPTSDRPYIDGSTNNSAIAMVFGYNGLGRFGVNFSGAVPSMFGGGGPGGDRPASEHGTDATMERDGVAPALVRELQRGFGPRDGGRWGKLAGSEFGPQIGWLFPLALLSLVCGLAWLPRTRRGNRAAVADGAGVDQRVRVGGFVLWGVWLLSFGGVFSAMKVIPHTAYVASLAPALAALSAAGIVMFWREYAVSDRPGPAVAAGSRRWWLLPVAVGAELGWSAYLWRSYRGFLPVAQWAIVIAGLAATAMLVCAKLSRPGRRRLVVLGALAGAATMVAAPTTWSASALDARYDGNEMNAIAGPPSTSGFGHMTVSIEHMLGLGDEPTRHDGMARHGIGEAEGLRGTGGSGGLGRPGGMSGSGSPGGSGIGWLAGSGEAGHVGVTGSPSELGGTSGTGSVSGMRRFGGIEGIGGMGGWGGSSTSLTGAERDVYSYVSARDGGARYLMATTRWRQAAPYILATGREVLPVGGFSGAVPSPTLARVRELVATGQLRFFLLSPPGDGLAGLFGQARAGQALTITNWVRNACEKLPGNVAVGELYRCGRELPMPL